MIRMKKIKCPYCGKKVPYILAFSEKDKGEHICKRCGKNSTIYFVKAFRVAILITLILSLIIMFISISPKHVNNLWGMLWVAVPFFILYLFTPMFYRLVPIKRKKSTSQGTDTGFISHDPILASGSTKIMPKVNEDTYEQYRTDVQKTRIMPAVDGKRTDDYTDISKIGF